MALLSEGEIKKLEKKHAAGISSADIVNAFASRGERFSEATLRKYVQLGLLPRSQRVGTEGRNRGSSGIYPIKTVRLVNAIKRALEDGATLSEIRLSAIALEGDLVMIRQCCEHMMGRLTEVVDQEADRNKRAALRKERDRIKATVEKNLTNIERFAERVARSRK